MKRRILTSQSKAQKKVEAPNRTVKSKFTVEKLEERITPHHRWWHSGGGAGGGECSSSWGCHYKGVPRGH